MQLYFPLDILFAFKKIKSTFTEFPKTKLGKNIFSQNIVDKALLHLIYVLLFPGHGNIKLFFNNMFLIIILLSIIFSSFISNTKFFVNH